MPFQKRYPRIKKPSFRKIKNIVTTAYQKWFDLFWNPSLIYLTKQIESLFISLFHAAKEPISPKLVDYLSPIKCHLAASLQPYYTFVLRFPHRKKHERQNEVVF